MARTLKIIAFAVAFVGLAQVFHSASAQDAATKATSCWETPPYRVLEGVRSEYSICFTSDGTWSGHITEKEIETGLVEAIEFWGHWRQVEGAVMLRFDPRSNGAGEVCRLEPEGRTFRVAEGCSLKGVVFAPK